MRDAARLIVRTRSSGSSARAVRATVFEEADGQARLPVRMVAIHLDWPQRRRLLRKETMTSNQLRSELARFYEEQHIVRSRDGEPITSGLGFRRVARVFLTQEHEDGTKVPTVLLVKPDERRYWTRSQGLRDADELATAIVVNKRKRGLPK